MANKTDGKLHGEIAYSVMATRLDIDGYRNQYKCFPPGMFTDKGALEEWLYDMEFRQGGVKIVEKKLQGIDLTNAVLLSAESGFRIAYESIWVLAKWHDYRTAMTAYVLAQGAGINGIREVDADHVINRDRVLAHHENAWVMLMPVPKSANRAFGSAIEKKLAPIDPNVDRQLIEPLVLFKTFSVESIKGEEDLEKMAHELRGQMAHDDTFDETMKLALEAYRDCRGWSRAK